MCQVISENTSQILLKRLVIFLGLLILAMVIVHFHQAKLIASYPALDKADNVFELNKTDIVFASINWQ